MRYAAHHLGIYPREPRSRKKANKGSSAPTSFYYAKDIAYIAHEPVLKKLREHKAFAKKLSRALGRGEWTSAKALEENKPVYQLDHIIKERYARHYCDSRPCSSCLNAGILPSSTPSEISTMPYPWFSFSPPCLQMHVCPHPWSKTALAWPRNGNCTLCTPSRSGKLSSR